MLKFGILEEAKVPPDERVPFTPRQCAQLMKDFPCEIIVQQSAVRRIPDKEYKAANVKVRKNLSDCDVLFGVKEVPKDRLIEGKTYLFFSHTIKKQPYNKELLQDILKKNIRLIDYECLVDEKDFRIIGFGRFAGLVGTYNGFRMIGRKTKKFDLKKAHDCHDQEEMYNELKKVDADKLRICLTGKGRVANGSIEILEKLGIPQVSPEDYLNKEFDHAVYTQLAVTDYTKRKDGKAGSLDDHIHHPDEYETNFKRFFPKTDYYIAGHFWDRRAPMLITNEELQSPEFGIKYIADISCDIGGPIASTIKATTIAHPYYSFDKKELRETDFSRPEALAVMAVDNLPCELPRDASEDFGRQLMEHVMPSFFNDDKKDILKKGTIAEGGALTERFEYLADYVSEK